MSSKSGKRLTGKKPAGSTRTSAKTDGAFGKEGVEQVSNGRDRNEDRAVMRRTRSSKA